MKKGVQPVGHLGGTELVQSVEDPRLEALYDHAVCTFDLPIHSRVRYRGPINVDVIFTVELEELLPGELRAVVHDDGVWDSKVMDDVEEEQHGLLELDHRDRPSFYTL